MFEKIVLILLGAAAGEGIIEFLVAPLFDMVVPENKSIRVFGLNLSSAILGLLLAFGFRFGIFTLFGAEEAIPYMDQVVTGLLMGRGSNWLHNLFKRFALDVQERLLSLPS